jgi:hypothetical protein
MSQTCKGYSPPKLRARILNASKNLNPSHLRQWMDEIYPRYSKNCGIAEPLAPLVRTGRVTENIIHHAAEKINPVWAKEIVNRANSGDFLVGGSRSSRSSRKTRRRRAARKTRKLRSRS